MIEIPKKSRLQKGFESGASFFSLQICRRPFKNVATAKSHRGHLDDERYEGHFIEEYHP